MVMLHGLCPTVILHLAGFISRVSQATACNYPRYNHSRKNGRNKPMLIEEDGPVDLCSPALDWGECVEMILQDILKENDLVLFVFSGGGLDLEKPVRVE